MSNVLLITIINSCKPLTSASLERRSLYHVRHKFIHESRSNNKSSQSLPSAYNTVKCMLYSRSCVHQRFSVIDYTYMNVNCLRIFRMWHWHVRVPGEGILSYTDWRMVCFLCRDLVLNQFLDPVEQFDKILSEIGSILNFDHLTFFDHNAL